MKNKLFILLGGIFIFSLLLGAGCSKDQQQNKSPAPDKNVVSVDDDSTKAEEADDTMKADDTTEADDVSEGEFPTEDEWQIYDGDGFTLRYPENWKISPAGILYKWREGIDEEFASQSDFSDISWLSTASIDVSVSSQDLTLEEIADDSNQESVMLAGISTMKVQCGGIRYANCVIVKHNGTTFLVTYAPSDATEEQSIWQILDTFQFAN